MHVGLDGALYCTDDTGHCVRKYTLDGKLLLTLGTPGKPTGFMGGAPFCRCCHTALVPNCDIFVADGYGNASFALLFIAFTKEYSTAIFLVAPGSELLGVSILQAWNQGAAGVTSALATIQIVMLTFFLFLAKHVLKVRTHG